MKKGVIILSLIFILLVSTVSAGFFSDLFSKNKITGNVVSEFPGLVAHYKFENNTLNSATNVAGNITGNFSYSSNREGIIEAAGVFGPNTEIAIGKPENLTNSLTWSGWIKLNKQPNPFLGIYARGGPAIKYSLSINNEGKVYVYFKQSGKINEMNSTRVVNDNAWHNLALVINYQSNRMILYIDGVLDKSKNMNLSGSRADPTMAARIGRGGFNNTEYYFDGLIDEIKIYDRAFNKTQIQELYNKQANYCLIDDNCSTPVIERYCETENRACIETTSYTCSDQVCTASPLLDCNYCPGSQSCFDGVCNSSTVVLEKVCPDLIEKIKYPKDIVRNGVGYRLSDNFTKLGGTYYIKGQEYVYDAYSAGWTSQLNNKYNSINYEIVSFNDSVNAQEILADNLVSNEICTLRYFYANGEQNQVYVCSYDPLDFNSEGYSSYKRNFVVWANQNIVVIVEANTWESIDEETLTAIREERALDLLDSLKNNKGEYMKEEEIELEQSAEDMILYGLESCSSGIEEECSPCWNCKIEPVLCPPHGEQTRTCEDKCCNSEKRVETTTCSPGECAGCYTPRWLGGSTNRCIPYGFRFAYEGLDDYEDEILGGVYQDGQMSMEIKIENDYSATMNMTIPQLSVYGRVIYFYEGNQINLAQEIPELEQGWGEEPTLYIKDIVYNSSMEGNGEIIFTLVDKYDAYCDIDGRVYKQKLKDYKGDWASCQNNYECESNLCNYGECTEVRDMFEDVNRFRSFFVRLTCRLGNIFNSEDYNQCVYDYLGEVPPSNIQNYFINSLVTEESVVLSKSSNKLNVGESLAGVYPYVNDISLPVFLADDYVEDAYGERYSYEQKIGFTENMKLENFSDLDYDNGNPTIGMKIDRGEKILNYTLAFTQRPDPQVIIGSVITILGKDYVIINFDRNTSKAYLMESAYTFVIEEGEQAVIDYNTEFFRGNLNVSLDYISATEVRLIVNGKATSSLKQGETARLEEGMYVYIKESMYSAKDSGISKVELSISPRMIRLENGRDLLINEEEINGILVNMIIDSLGLSRIFLTWTSEDEQFLTPENSLELPGLKDFYFTLSEMKYASGENYTDVNFHGRVYSLISGGAGGGSSL